MAQTLSSKRPPRMVGTTEAEAKEEAKDENGKAEGTAPGCLMDHLPSEPCLMRKLMKKMHSKYRKVLLT